MGQSAGPGPGPGRGPDPRRPGAARAFAGNHPSATIILEDLSPENVGRLLAFYEARTVYEGFIWGVHSFDQFGVELGKKVADGPEARWPGRTITPATTSLAVIPSPKHTCGCCLMGTSPYSVYACCHLFAFFIALTQSIWLALRSLTFIAERGKRMTLTKAQIVEAIAEQNGFSKNKSQRRGRNTATGGDLRLYARKVLTFQCSEKLMDKLNG